MSSDGKTTFAQDAIPCLARYRGYLCTDIKGHKGKHVASDGDVIVAEWPSATRQLPH